MAALSGPGGKVAVHLLAGALLAFLAPLFPQLALPLYGLAIVVVAKLLGFLTEELAQHTKPSLAALLTTTLGNLAELVLAMVALSKGMGEVVKASITGSIMGNLLFVLGLGAVVASTAKRVVAFKAPMDLFILSTLLPMLMLLAPSFMPLFHEESHIGEVSLYIALFFLLFYALFLRKAVEEEERRKRHRPSLGLGTILGGLLLSTALLVWASEGFVGSLEGLSSHLSHLFMGAIVLGFVGSIAEHIYVIDFARKGRFSLVLHSTLGSTVQIVLFVLPVLYLYSLLIGSPMPLYFHPIEVFALSSSALLVWAVIEDRKVRALEGIGLMGLFFLLALLFYYSPV